MNPMHIHISEQARSNLLIFLNRVELKGLEEVQAFTEIIQALQSPIPAETSDQTT
jgi:hypothetical protein